MVLRGGTNGGRCEDEAGQARDVLQSSFQVRQNGFWWPVVVSCQVE